MDSVLKQYDFRNRWLAAEEGNWFSRDPLGNIDSENLYQLFSCNRLRLVDQFGLFDCDTSAGWTEHPLHSTSDITYCVREGNRDTFEGACQGMDGCTVLEWDPPPNDAMITAEIDCSGFSITECFEVIAHEAVHVEEAVACVEGCDQANPSDPAGFDNCMTTCWINDPEPEKDAQKVQDILGEIFDFLGQLF